MNYRLDRGATPLSSTKVALLLSNSREVFIMKQKYEPPMIEVFDLGEDIITASGDSP